MLRLQRADRAVAPAVGLQTERLGQRGDLDGVAELRARAMRFDVADRVRVDVGHRLRRRDDGRLSVNARRGVSNLEGAVVVERGAADHRVDVIAVREGVGEPLQNDDADTVATDGAARARRRTRDSGRPAT